MKLACLAGVILVTQIPIEVPTPPPVSEPDGPIVVLETSEGTIRIGLYASKAPLGVENFLSYARSDHYVGTIFHRVMPDFMIQGGGLDANLEERPTGPPVRNEASNLMRNSRGSVALARRDEPDSATSQFFINLRNNHRLDYGISGAGYTVIGKVLEGMEVVDRIAQVPTHATGPHGNVPDQPITIVGVRIEGEP